MSRRPVLVTGAAGGIGMAAVRALVDRGYPVFAAVRADAGPLAGLPGVWVVTMDVTDPESVAQAVKQVRREVGDGGLRAVVNNAGVIVQGPLELMPPSELRRQFEVNTFGPAYVAQQFLPMLRAGEGRVINVSAPTARVAMPFLAALSGSKAALDSLSAALRLELAAWRIPVVTVEPGATETAIFDKAGAAARDALDLTEPHRVALYHDHLAALEKVIAGQRLRPARPVARAILSAVDARRPKRRYVVADARLASVLVRLPAGLRDRLIAGVMGLRGIRAGAPAGPHPR
jgi:NAD(P)-dependent dehydrogenase (short-subunit alcohol dehydrogenase family)